jgi:hypothetical protein
MNLYYKTLPKGKSFGEKQGDSLKIALRNKRDVDSVGVVFNGSDIEYLKGLRDGGLKDAQLVIDAIKKYEVINIYLE